MKKRLCAQSCKFKQTSNARHCHIIVVIVMMSLASHGCFRINPKTHAWAQALEHRREAIGGGLVTMTRDVDAFFGDERVESEYKDLRVAVTAKTSMLSGEGASASLPISGTFPLPILRNQLAFIYGSETDFDRLNGDLSTARNRNVESGLRYLSDKGPWTYKMSAGARWQGGPVAYAQPGVRYEWSDLDYVGRVTQSLLWDSHDGFGEDSEFEFDYEIFKGTYVRTHSGALYAETSKGVEFSQVFVLRTVTTGLWAAAIDFGIDLSTRPSFSYDANTLTFRYHSVFLFPWLEQEIAPYVTWQKVNSYHAQPGLALSLKVIFESPKLGKKKTTDSQPPRYR